MKAGLFFTGSGPLLILTSYDSLTNPDLVKKLHAKGIKKFLAFEVPVGTVKEQYGIHYDLTLSDLKQEDDLRVLDYDGHHILNHFSLKQLQDPVSYE